MWTDPYMGPDAPILEEYMLSPDGDTRLNPTFTGPTAIKINTEFHKSSHAEAGVNDIMVCCGCIEAVEHAGWMYSKSVTRSWSEEIRHEHKYLLEYPTVAMVNAWIWLAEEAYETVPKAFLGLFKEKVEVIFGEKRLMILKFKGGDFFNGANYEHFVPADDDEAEAGREAIKDMLANDRRLRHAFNLMHQLFGEGKPTEDLDYATLSKYYNAVAGCRNLMEGHKCPGIVVDPQNHIGTAKQRGLGRIDEESEAHKKSDQLMSEDSEMDEGD